MFIFDELDDGSYRWFLPHYLRLNLAICFQGSFDLGFPCCIDRIEGIMSPLGWILRLIFEGIVLPPASIHCPCLDAVTLEEEGFPQILV